jgi:hypothetical protein
MLSACFFIREAWLKGALSQKQVSKFVLVWVPGAPVPAAHNRIDSEK